MALFHALAFLCLSPVPVLQDTADTAPPWPALEWDRGAVQHLMNRVAFGATPEELEQGLALGPEALIDHLLQPRQPWQPVEPHLLRWEDFGLNHMQLPLEGTEFEELPAQDQVEKCKSSRVLDRIPFLAMYEQWMHSMIEHRDPLRDRMTLFWHGFFTTSVDVNKRKFELVHQFQWLRSGACESYADLLRGLVRDPAMLQYLDNTSNLAGHPNENLARELMELFSLGEGNYTEQDVTEAARALTGAAGSTLGTYEFLADHHDTGEKTVLGVTGNLGPDELVDLLLDQEACSLWVAGRLIEYFEGLAPEAQRHAEYARFLKDQDYSIEPFLRRLFLDPAFYRDEVRGNRVSGPIELVATQCHLLGMRPSGEYLHRATAYLGQTFYAPPSVKGWPSGLGWIQSDGMMRRSNNAGLMLGALEPCRLAGIVAEREAAAAQACESEMEMEMEAVDSEVAAKEQAALRFAIHHLPDEEMRSFQIRRKLDSHGDLVSWSPPGDLLEKPNGYDDIDGRADRLMAELLVVEVSEATREAGRVQFRELASRAHTEGETWETAVRKYAHYVLSLPEAQLR